MLEVRDRCNLNAVHRIIGPNFIDNGLAPSLSKQEPEGAREPVTQFRSADAAADFVEEFPASEAVATGAEHA